MGHKINLIIIKLKCRYSKNYRLKLLLGFNDFERFEQELEQSKEFRLFLYDFLRDKLQ